MQLTLLFVHRDAPYRSRISRLLVTQADPDTTLDVREAETLAAAKRLLPLADRLLFDASARDVLNWVDRRVSEIPAFALASNLDSTVATHLLYRGVIPVGRCESGLDVVMLLHLIVEGLTVARPRTAAGAYASTRLHEHRAVLAETLALNRYNVSATAKYLGLPRTTIQSQMKKLGLARNVPRALK